jgi:hypothetical protein
MWCVGFSGMLLSFVTTLQDDQSSCKVYASQTKILEGRTKDWVCLFEALFKGGRRTIEKCFEKTVPTFCSAFQNLRLGSIKLLQKIVASQKNRHITSHVATIFCNHLAKLLQKLIASQKTNSSHVATIFCYHLAKLLQKIVASHKNNTSHVATIFCYHLAKLLQKIIASQKNQHIASHITIFCNHLANLLQKFIASQKTNTSHRMLLSFVSSCKVVIKEHSFPENQHIDSHATIILQSCYKR